MSLAYERRRIADAAGEKAATERRECDERHAELIASIEQRDFGIAAPQRVLALNGSDRMHAHARLRKVVAETSDKPSVRTLPAFTSCAIAPTLSSIGTCLSQRCR